MHPDPRIAPTTSVPVALAPDTATHTDRNRIFFQRFRGPGTPLVTGRPLLRSLLTLSATATVRAPVRLCLPACLLAVLAHVVWLELEFISGIRTARRRPSAISFAFEPPGIPTECCDILIIGDECVHPLCGSPSLPSGALKQDNPTSCARK
jgi:hypothetical protein